MSSPHNDASPRADRFSSSCPSTTAGAAPTSASRGEAQPHADTEVFRLTAESSAASPVPPAERLRLLESVVLHSPDAVLITDAGAPPSPDPRIVFVNEAFTRLTGYPAAACIGRNPRFLQGPLTERAPLERIRAALRDGRAVTAELINHHRDGSPVFLETHIIPIAGSDGRVAHWVGIHRDLGERRRAAQERERIEQGLREMQRLESVGLLAGGIAHDFNNLLTVILGNATLARSGPTRPEELAEHLRLVESAAMRAADLCRQMLAYAGRGRGAMRAVDFNALVRDTADLVRASAAKNCTLVLDLGEGLPQLAGDATQLQQVVMNLLINAAEAIGAATGRIETATRLRTLGRADLDACPAARDLPAGDYLQIEVRDNGCGMSPETKARIFEPFFTTKFTGRGLGLATVAGIVRGHRGALDVESEPGRGTCFRIWLPLHPSTGPDSGKSKGPKVGDPDGSAGGSAGTSTPGFPPVKRRDGSRPAVLVIDDERLIRETARAVLTLHGYEVLSAPDADTGLALLCVHGAPLDAILLDLSLPGLDGEAAYAELRKVDGRVPVLLMSGYSEEEARSRFAPGELAGFVSKPFTAGQLAAAVDLARRSGSGPLEPASL